MLVARVMMMMKATATSAAALVLVVVVVANHLCDWSVVVIDDFLFERSCETKAAKRKRRTRERERRRRKCAVISKKSPSEGTSAMSFYSITQ